MNRPDLALVYRARRRVGEERVAVECRADRRHFTLRIGPDAWRVARSSGEIETFGRTLPPSAIDAATLLSLALRGVFSLHASAVESPAGVIAFLGRSGAGKSTLAAHLAGRAAAWPLVSDDILPVDFAARRPRAAREISPGARPEARRLSTFAAAYLLRRSRGPRIRTRLLPPREAVVALVRHSVATRFFDTPLRASHFEAWVSAAASVPVREIFYPRDLARLEEVARRIAEDLGLPSA